MTDVAPSTRLAVDLRARNWPGLDALPAGPRARFAARVARSLFKGAVNRLDVTVHVGEQTFGRGGPVMVVSRPEEFFLRLGRDQLIGFGEAYLTGAWDAEDLGGFLAVLAARMQHLVPEPLQRLRALVVRQPPEEELSSTENSLDNIAHHYDLSNDLFELFLDPTLSYSSALFPTPSWTGADAQRPRGRAGPQDRPAARPGRRRRRAPGCSRSAPAGASWPSGPPAAAPPSPPSRSRPSRRRWPTERIAAAGFSDRVSVELSDYRDVTGDVRRRRVGRDDRGGRLAVLADLLRDHRPGARARRQGRDPGDHHAPRPDAGDPQHLHLDQQVHLPRRLPALGPGHRRDHPRAHLAADGRAAVHGGVVRRDAAAVGRARSWPSPRRCSTSASTRRSCGCGTSTSSTRGPASRRATSTCTSSPSPARCGVTDTRSPASPPRDRPRRTTADGRAAPGRGAAAVPRRRPAGAAEGLGRLGGRPGRRAAGRAQLGRRRAPPAVAPGRARRRAGLRHRRDRRPRRPRRTPSRTPSPWPSERGLSGWRPSVPRRWSTPSAPPLGIGALGRPPAAPRVAGPAARSAAQPAARPQRDLVPLRPVQRVLRADPRAADGLLLRLPLHARRPGRAGAARQAARWSAASSASSPG